MSLLYKVVLIGESDVGKSSLFIRFRDGKFIEHMKSTIGLDNATKEIKFTKSESDKMETTAKIQLWDTAGLERTGRLTNTYFNYSYGVILMYDISDKVTLSRLGVWHENAASCIKSANTKYFVVGNKSDVSSGDIDVTEAEAFALAEERLKIPKEHVFRVSAKTGEGLEQMLIDMARVLSAVQLEKPETLDMIKDEEDGRKSQRKPCCGS